MTAGGTTGGGRPRRPAAELDLFGAPPPADDRRYDRRPRKRTTSLVPGASPESAISVDALTRTAREILEGAFLPLWVRGEVSDFKAYRNGHWYFCLRDAAAQLRCVVWSRDQWRLPAPPDDGMQVAAYGQLTLYPARGEMQLVVSRLEAEGEGLWRKSLERTLARLRAEGLLAEERKRPIPRFARRIAVVTSVDGAALRDIIAVVRRRCPVAQVVVVAARVQGEGAPEELANAIERIGRWRQADLVIVGRGGGAREDLWAFNDERVARALAACPVPTISAVGHEVDLTICDLVADLRAPTPSAAAEAAVPVLDDVHRALAATEGRLRAALERHATRARHRLQHAERDLAVAAARDVEQRRLRLESLAARLHALSPLATLARGYAIATDADGHTLGSAADFGAGKAFRLTLRDGDVDATTTSVRGRRVPIPEPQAPPAGCD
jgi:exodeoxyribonuclease VII large subunit